MDELTSTDIDAPVIGTPEFSRAFLGRFYASPPTSLIGARQQRLADAISLMLERPFEPLSVRRLAAAAGMSESSFTRLFRLRFGQAPIEFLKTERLRHAAHLLRTTSWPVKTVAMKSGYASRSYFSRAFQEAFGIPPAAVRASDPLAGSVSEAERERLRAVRRYDLFDLPPAGCFDRIAALAARRFDVPIGLITLVDHDRIRLRARYGCELGCMPREPGLCESVLQLGCPLVLADARDDVRARANSLVSGDLGVRFYAGVPLRSPAGHGLGTLCIADRAPRNFGRDHVGELEELAVIVMDQLLTRLATQGCVRVPAPLSAAACAAPRPGGSPRR